ncbi:MAG: sensor histidine kinase [Flavobacteriales bacterium]|jgi:two-component system NarL family sensor kinase
MSASSLVVVGILAMTIMAMGVVLFVLMYQKRVGQHKEEMLEFERRRQIELLKASIASEEEERSRIASELHDDVGATLAISKIYLSKLRETVSDNAHLNSGIELLEDSLSKVRDISQKIQPSNLFAAGLAAALRSTADKLRNSGEMKVTFTGPELGEREDMNVELHLFRVFQELVTNMVKYAKASEVWINFSQGKTIEIRLKHDGDGLSKELYKKKLAEFQGNGLKSIEKRLKIIHGKLSFGTESEHSEIIISVDK